MFTSDGASRSLTKLGGTAWRSLSAYLKVSGAATAAATNTVSLRRCIVMIQYAQMGSYGGDSMTSSRDIDGAANAL